MVLTVLIAESSELMNHHRTLAFAPRVYVTVRISHDFLCCTQREFAADRVKHYT